MKNSYSYVVTVTKIWFISQFPRSSHDTFGSHLRIYGFFITTYHHSNASSEFAGVAMKCTLHCHSILTTPLPLRNGIAVSICIFAMHSNAASVAHSIATPTSLSKYTPMPLRGAHFIATPLLPLQCHYGVSLECYFAYLRRTPMPIQYHPIRSECHCSVHSGLWK